MSCDYCGSTEHSTSEHQTCDFCESRVTPIAVDDYDQHDQLFQFQEGHLVFAYNILAASTVPAVIYHLNSGRYFVTAAANEDRPPDNSVAFNAGYFTSDSVQKMTAK